MHPESRGSSVALVLAAGSGERFGAEGGKQMAPLAGEPVLSHTLRAFDAATSIGFIVVACHPERIEEYSLEAVAPSVTSKEWLVVAGGESRQESVGNALDATRGIRTESIVVIHDGARALVTAELIDAMVERLLAEEELDGIVAGHPAYDTLKEVYNDRIISTVDRGRFWHAQTPQIFRRDRFETAHSQATAAKMTYTDDEAVMSAAGYRVAPHLAPRENLKITVAEDMVIAQAILGERKRR